MTRAIGDAPLSSVLTAEPDLVVLRLTGGSTNDNVQKEEPRVGRCADFASMLGRSRKNVSLPPLFIILASDGLFDVLSNEEAADVVCAHLLSAHAQAVAENGAAAGLDTEDQVAWDRGIIQSAARALMHEAVVRGSGDNIGVCVVGLGGLGTLG